MVGAHQNLNGSRDLTTPLEFAHYHNSICIEYQHLEITIIKMHRIFYVRTKKIVKLRCSKKTVLQYNGCYSRLPR